jgi:hypothetical protein
VSSVGAGVLPRFTRLHLWLVVATCLAAGASAALLVLDWQLLWAVPAGPFAGLLHRGGFTSWSRGVGAFSLTLLPWAFGGLALGVSAQWLVPLRGRGFDLVRLVLWGSGWATWFACGFLSCLNTYG